MKHSHRFTAERTAALANDFRASIAFVEAQQSGNCGCTKLDYCPNHYAEQQAWQFGYSSVAEFRAECLRLSLVNMAANEDEPDFGDDERPLSYAERTAWAMPGVRP